MFKERLRKLRENTGASQEDIANAVGITRLSVGNYERGVRTPDIAVLIKMATHFNVSADYLLGRTNNPFLTEGDAAKKAQELQAELDALRQKILLAKQMFE